MQPEQGSVLIPVYSETPFRPYCKGAQFKAETQKRPFEPAAFTECNFIAQIYCPCICFAKPGDPPENS
jgi:hypothetical protein